MNNHICIKCQSVNLIFDKAIEKQFNDGGVSITQYYKCSKCDNTQTIMIMLVKNPPATEYYFK